MDFFGRAGFIASDFVGQAFVIAHVEPVLSAVGCSGLEHSVKFFDQGLRQFIFGMVDDIVDAAEVVGRLHDVVHIDAVLGDADCVGLEDIPGLFVGEPAALDVVGVVGQVNLGAVVNAAADFPLFFFSESFEKGRGFLFASARVDPAST